jgi:hypothetical protein
LWIYSKEGKRIQITGSYCPLEPPVSHSKNKSQLPVFLSFKRSHSLLSSINRHCPIYLQVLTPMQERMAEPLEFSYRNIFIRVYLIAVNLGEFAMCNINIACIFQVTFNSIIRNIEQRQSTILNYLQKSQHLLKTWKWGHILLYINQLC